jgi:N-methylhydantoinase B
MMDPIAPEILRTMLEAIGQEAGAAVEQTAISPIVTESKDYSVTICDGDGAMLSGTGVQALHFGAAMHAVCATIAAHGDSVAEGDVFVANDPHSGGGVHPQDVVIQRPIFVAGRRVAWVALAAHMMDMGGMVPGSSAPQATECYQEALRLPPVRLVRRHVEVDDIWNILRINIRSADLVEMDMRSLVIGAGVAERKLVELVGNMGVPAYAAAAAALLASTEMVLRQRIGELEDGHYLTVARVEYKDGLLRIPCDLAVSGDRLSFDLSQAPAQVPHFFNSKAYILRAAIVPRIRELLAPGLPINQSFYTVAELVTVQGSIVDSIMPAPIAAAHMDAAMAVDAAAWQCLQLAIHASPRATGRQFLTAPAPAAYGVGRWNYLDAVSGQRRVYTLLGGSLCGSPAAASRDGIDLKSSVTASGSRMEYADIEILESAYPVLFRERGSASGVHGYGSHRSGLGCREAFQPHGIDSIVGNMTGTRSWFPAAGGAGGLPGATTRFAITRGDGSRETLALQAAGVTIVPGDHFEMSCASGGGFGDPLDREPAMVLRDLRRGRIDDELARAIYGVVRDQDGEIDAPGTDALRNRLRRDRLAQAAPARFAAPGATVPANARSSALPLYPGVVQHGDLAVADASGAVLAVAPGNWLDGCPLLDMPVGDPVRGVIARAHLDPVSGTMLFTDVIFAGETPSLEVRPDRWVRANTMTAAA